jgi:MoxR-like ATPase
MSAAAQASEMHSRTILFVDEIHRFNKAQQDAFLPYVERGTIRLIGATTENPSFEIISALLSAAASTSSSPWPTRRLPPSSAAPLKTRNAASARSISPPTTRHSR